MQKTSADAAPAVPGYALLRLLGQGDSCDVWLASDPAGEALAIKLIRPGARRGALAESLRHEHSILSLLAHPHIIRAHGSGEAAGQAYLALEHVDGQTLIQWLSLRRPLAARLALLRQIAQALDYVHSQQIAHRDLTASNVLVDQHGAARLIDFDKARREANPASDVHALGRMMAMLLESDGGRELAAITERAAAGRPQDRYASVAEVLADLDHHAARRPVPAYSTTRRYRLRKWLSRHRHWLGAALLVAITLAAALVPGGVRLGQLRMVSPTGLEPVTR